MTPTDPPGLVMVAETLWELNKDLGHWMYELEGELITALLLVLWHVVWQKGHDRKHHSDESDG